MVRPRDSTLILPSRADVQRLRGTTIHGISDSPRWEVASMKRRTKARRSNRQKTKLGLPDLEHVKSAVLVSLRSPESQRSYRRSIDDFVCWYCSEPRLSFNKTVVTRYRIHLEDKLLAPGTINVRLAAVRRLAYEAADTGLLSPDLAAGIRRVKGAKKLGMRLGNWLTVEEARALWQLPNMHTVMGKRDRAILAVLLGCGLRRRELTDLTVDHLQRREDHWAIVDLVGKGGHIRTVPMPDWVKQTVDQWLSVAEIAHGRIFRCVCRRGVVWGTKISEKVVWHVVKEHAVKLGVSKLAPHDLRRSCARFCHDSGGELEQIQFLLGHVSVQTTEKYLGCKQRFRHAVNDRLGIEPDSPIEP
jgi:site-specific recombinase XerD